MVYILACLEYIKNSVRRGGMVNTWHIATISNASIGAPPNEKENQSSVWCSDKDPFNL